MKLEVKERLWIDTHIHVGDIAPDGKKCENMAAELEKVFNKCDVDLRLIVSCEQPYLIWMKDDPAAIFRANKMVYDLVKLFPGRLFGSCMINPNFLEESLRVMDICFSEWGFVQLGEMIQYIMGYRMNSDAGVAVARKAAEYDVPIQVHLGTYCKPKKQRSTPNINDINPETIEIIQSTAGMNQFSDMLGLAEKVPEAKYILAHAIGCGPTSEYIPWANMFLDTIAGLYPEYPDNFWIEIRDFNAPALKRTLAEVPADRLLCGTDWTTRNGWPFLPYGTSFEMCQPGAKDNGNMPVPEVASFIEFLEKAGASEKVINMIGSENAKELYRLDI